jgi:hypothetical protein
MRYRPDNGAALVDALRVGAFGGSTVDAVEAAILVRASAGITTTGLTVSTLVTGLVKSSSGGSLSTAVANTDYLPVANPTATGTATLDTVKYGIETISDSTTFILNASKKRMINITATGTASIALPTPGALFAGREYKLNLHGNCDQLFVGTESSSDVLVVWWNQNNPGPTQYWSEKAGGWNFSPSSSSNRSADLWCDGVFWYIRW